MDHREPPIQSPHGESEAPISDFAKHRFVVMIAGSIVIALLLVVVSMQLYFSSGTAQLDLSRPGYKAVRDQLRTESTYDGFSGSGPINEAALKDFKELYDKRAKDASADAFDGDALSDKSLGIDTPVAQ